jgi:hypothetical protein
MSIKIFGFTAYEIFVMIFILPVIKGAFVDALCEIGTMQCILGYLLLIIIPALPIVFFVLDRIY